MYLVTHSTDVCYIISCSNKPLEALILRNRTNMKAGNYVDYYNYFIAKAKEIHPFNRRCFYQERTLKSLFQSDEID